MGLKCPRSLEFMSFDEVFETMDGVSPQLERDLVDLMVEDERNPEDDWDPASWRACSPNNVMERWDELTTLTKCRLIKVARLNFGVGS